MKTNGNSDEEDISSGSSRAGETARTDLASGLDILRAVLPARQPQGGSPANTFTGSELDELRSVLGSLNLGPREVKEVKSMLPPSVATNPYLVDILDPATWGDQAKKEEDKTGGKPKDTVHTENAQEAEVDTKPAATLVAVDQVSTWFGAPKITTGLVTQAFRQKVREGVFKGPTNSQCPGYLQCNMVVLPEGQHAFDFLMFCQRNNKACPLVEVCDVGSPHPHGVARGADLRTDVPKYAIYRDGKLDKEVHDVTEYWPERSIAFLIGCSFTTDGALQDAGIRLRSADQGKNVPMYRTNLDCRPAGSLRGKMVVSMKPIKALDVAKEVEITSQYPQAHGGPICVGSAAAIGIRDINNPEWGDPVEIKDDEIPIFHACGVTPQSVLMESKVPFAITHSAGHMFVTDLPSDTAFC